ncbi:MucBP domain-containing protein, partial [Limosilactobacillus vaginalis]|uniref:MucBP domain-containing protein n=2 Tax=Limosilactobacillus vaginalis TaxID=1633 RepID=UPI0025A456E5
YVYEKDPVTPTPEVKRGTVTVEYVDKNGNPLPGGQQTTVKDNVPVGEDYTTEEKQFDGYHFVGMDKTSDPANGKVAEGTKHVIYVYEKDVTPEVKRGTVTVEYVDKNGNPLPGGQQTTVKDNVPVGEDYTTEEKTFDGYHFVGMDKTSDPANGKVAEGTKHVIYVYEKDPVAQTGNVDVQYITYVDGKAVELPGGERTPLFTTDQAVDTPYTTNVRNFDNYHFVGMDQSSAAATGKVTNGVQHVIYVYEKNVTPTVQRGSVDVIYVDEHGNPLPGGELTTVKSNEPVGTSYTTTQREFEGYTFTRMGTGSATPSGTVVPGVSHVIYVYTKDEPLPTPKPGIEGGTVTVTYVDEHGNPLPGGEETTVKDKAPVGETYTTTQRDFDGYHFTRMGEGSATPTGTVVPGTTRVIYVYTKDEPLPTPKPGIEGGTVTVTYVDEHGNPLPGGEETTVKDHAPVGETYTTTQRDFPGYTFTGMGEGSATPTGIVVPGTTRVVYVYTKTPTPTTETPTTPTTSTTPTPTASTPVAPAPVTPVAPSQPAAPASAKLPQTGNQANDSTAALGLAGLGLSALAALGLRKKKNS